MSFKSLCLKVIQLGVLQKKEEEKMDCSKKIHQCKYCSYSSNREYNMLRHFERKHTMNGPAFQSTKPSISIPTMNMGECQMYPASYYNLNALWCHCCPPQPPPGGLPKKVDPVEYDKKLLEESEEVLKIYKLLQRMKQDNAK